MTTEQLAEHAVSTREAAEAQCAPAGRWREAAACIGLALAAYLVGGVLVAAGVEMGLHLLAPSHGAHSIPRVSTGGSPRVAALTLWDGQWYLQIATQGYTYDPDKESSVAFFPAYPALVAGVLWGTALDMSAAALLVSHAALVGAMALLIYYARSRAGASPARTASFALLALALFPTAFFMRMAYTESLFLFVSLLAFVAIQRKWPLPAIGLIAGLAAATRLAGLAVGFAAIVYACQRSGSWKQALRRGAYLTPLAAWGLLAYVGFQWWSFDEPLAFAKTQAHWHLRPPTGIGDRVLGLLSAEPIWSVYLPGQLGYWGSVEKGLPMAFSFQLANPTLFLLAAGLVYVGAYKRWLSGTEIVFAFGVLAISYFGAGYNMCMASQARYASVIFPMYLVLGELLSRAPAVIATGVFCVSAVYLTVYTALLAAGYYVI